MKRLLSFVTLLAAASSFAFASNHLWDMAQWKNNVVVDEGNTSGSVEYDGLKYYRGGGNAFADGAKEFSDGKTWNTRLKLGGKSTLSSESASRVFEFTADKGDVVTLYVVHGSSSGGDRTAYLSDERSAKAENALLAVPTKAGRTGTAKVTLPEDGTYYVWADQNVGISCIRVDGIPTEYNNVKTAIEQTRNEWNDIAKDVAKYAVGNLTALFTGLNTQLNDKAKTIDEVEAELEALLKEHQAGGELDWTWSAKETELIGKLNDLNLSAFDEQLPYIADMELEGYYDDIKEAADSIAKLTVANAKTWAADSLGGEVTDSLETVINSIAAACAQGTLTSEDQFGGDLAKVSALVDNVLMRASEQDSITRAAVVATDTMQVARGIVASIEGQEFAEALLPAYKAGLDAIDANIKALQAEADKDTLRLRGYTSKIAEWTAKNNANIKAVADTIAKYNGLLNDAAFNFQDDMADSVQSTYDKFYFLISAKYENELDVQKDYQQRFAIIQVKLSNERDTIDKYYSEVKSVEYNGTAVKNLETIQGDIENLWKSAQDAKDAAILAANDSLYKMWEGIDDSLHTTYVNHIKSVEVYKGIAATAEGNEVSEAVNDAEAALFPKLDEINKLNAEAKEAKENANLAVVYFDYDGFKADADEIFSSMLTIISQARSSVNTAAKNVFDQTVDSYYHEEYGYASGLIANAERDISRYDEDVKNFATDSLDVMSDSINTMKTLASGLYSRTTLPDSLDYCLSQLAFIPEAVDYLKAETFAHKEVADSLKNLSAYWTVAWSGKTDETKADLQDIYDEITALQGKVTESVGKMVESREALLDEAADLYNKVFKYADPEAAAANDAAYEALTAAAAEIGTKLKEVAAAIDGYTEAVKNEYAPVADGYEAQLNGISECVEEAYASRTLAAGQEELQAQLDNLKTLVDSLAAEAAEAEAEATRTEGDLNGDNVVDASDFELMWQYVMDGSAEGDLNGDGTTNVIDVTILSNIYGAAE